jgi:hypothetical protein
LLVRVDIAVTVVGGGSNIQRPYSGVTSEQRGMSTDIRNVPMLTTLEVSLFVLHRKHHCCSPSGTGGLLLWPAPERSLLGRSRAGRHSNTNLAETSGQPRKTLILIIPKTIE